MTARDAFGNAIPDLAVTLAATGSGVSLTQPDGPTGGDGTATGRLSSSVPGDHVEVVSHAMGGRDTQVARGPADIIGTRP